MKTQYRRDTDANSLPGKGFSGTCKTRFDPIITQFRPNTADKGPHSETPVVCAPGHEGRKIAP